VEIIRCFYCAVFIIWSGAFTYAVPISPKKADDNTVDVKSDVKEISKWISIILSKNIVDVNNLRMKRQLDPTSAEALKQYWNWKKSNGTGNSQLRYGRSVNNTDDEQNDKSVLRSKRSAPWSYHVRFFIVHIVGNTDYLYEIHIVTAKTTFLLALSKPYLEFSISSMSFMFVIFPNKSR
jgi:hypothetical protein